MITIHKLHEEAEKILNGKMTWENLEKLKVLFAVCKDLERYKLHAECKKMSAEDAHKWVACMKNADGTVGPHWTIDQVKQLMQQRCTDYDPVRIWVAMNAEYSDRALVNKKHNICSAEYYLDSALAFWFEDADAVPNKLDAYYEHVVKH